MTREEELQKELDTIKLDRLLTRKWRLLSWAIYTLGCFLIMLIGFDAKTSISVSIIIGFVCGLLNEVTQTLIKIHAKLK